MLVPILVVRLLECGEICSVCYACLASVLVALPLCLEKIRVFCLLFLCWLLKLSVSLWDDGLKAILNLLRIRLDH